MNWKKHIKNLLVFIFTLLAVVLGGLIAFKFIRFFMPFVIGWLIALIANPLVRMLERRMKVARKHTSMLLIIAVLAAIIGGIYFIGMKTLQEASSLIEQAPEIYSSFREDFQEAGENLSMIIEELPDGVQKGIADFQDSLGNMIGTAVGKISQITVDQASNFAKNLPSIIIAIIFTILSSYFFIADRDKILEFGREHTPQLIQEKWFNEKVAPDWMTGRQKMMSLLQDEAELEEIVKMVGMDALSAGDRLKMEAARSIREDFLHQNSFHEVDTYSSLKKQYLLMKLVVAYYEQGVEALEKGANIQDLVKLDVREKIGRFKYVLEENLDEEYKAVLEQLAKEISNITGKEDF